MNKIYLVSIVDDNEEDHGVYTDIKEAIRAAIDEWDRLSVNDKKNSRLELRAYEHDVEVDDPVSFDYDTIDWR